MSCEKQVLPPLELDGSVQNTFYYLLRNNFKKVSNYNTYRYHCSSLSFILVSHISQQRHHRSLKQSEAVLALQLPVRGQVGAVYGAADIIHTELCSYRFRTELYT